MPEVKPGKTTTEFLTTVTALLGGVATYAVGKIWPESGVEISEAVLLGYVFAVVTQYGTFRTSLKKEAARNEAKQ